MKKNKCNEIILITSNTPWDENENGVSKIIANIIKWSKETKFHVIALNEKEKQPDSRKSLMPNMLSYQEVKTKKHTRYVKFLLNFITTGTSNDYIKNRDAKKILKYVAQLDRGLPIHIIGSNLVSLVTRPSLQERNILFSLIDNHELYLWRRLSKEFFFKKMWSLFQIFKTRHVYNKIGDLGVTYHFVSELDEREFRKLGHTKTVTIENGVDIDFTDIIDRTFDEIKDHVIFHGNMGYLPNKIAANEIVKFALSNKNVSYLIFGHNSNKIIPLSNNLRVIGSVGNVFDLLRVGEIYFAPLTIGSGIKNKILEAMARGMCVVTTEIGVDGINPPCDSYFQVPESSVETVELLLRLLNAPSLRLSTGLSAKKFIADKFGWSEKVSAYEKLYEFNNAK